MLREVGRRLRQKRDRYVSRTNVDRPGAEQTQPSPETLAHAGQLPLYDRLPAYLESPEGLNPSKQLVCWYCGVGDSASLNEDDGRLVARGTPSRGCVKLNASAGKHDTGHRLHVTPSVLEGSRRRAISYEEAIERLAELLLQHRPPQGRTLTYASGQVDYFTVFALQETMRLLGVRNVAGNAEHCLNAGATHNEFLTGQEGPFLTIDQAVEGPDRLFLFNGWNGLITHPPIFKRIMERPRQDNVFCAEVMLTETSLAVKERAPHRALLLRPRTDAHVAIAVAREIFRSHPRAIDRRFIERFCDQKSYRRFVKLARSPHYDAEVVAKRIAPETRFISDIERWIRELACALARPECVPIVIPSVGLSQTNGIVAHCLWGNVLAILGKYGLRDGGTPAGGILRLPGQGNAQSEVQGLGRNIFMGRIPLADAREAATRMGLPDDAYEQVASDAGRPVIDYWKEMSGTRELFLFLGTQFEANMPNRQRWLRKLARRETTSVVVDPYPDPWSLRNATLIIPSPPHAAAAKLFQNGEWRMTLSKPRRRPAPQTRTDPTILYDTMARIESRLATEAPLAAAHPDLAAHQRSGYLRQRFACQSDGGGLPRIQGEVSRRVLWERIQAYMVGGRGPLYCTPTHDDGQPIQWDELLAADSIIYGGVGTRRFLLDYDDPGAVPFRDIYGEPHHFRFFHPAGEDLMFTKGVVLNTGRSTLTDDADRIRFATATFNSGKGTSVEGMPQHHPVHVSPVLAEQFGIETGQVVRLRSYRGHELFVPAIVNPRLFGTMVYMSFHRSQARDRGLIYINDVTDDNDRCLYSGQARIKLARVTIEPTDECWLTLWEREPIGERRSNGGSRAGAIRNQLLGKTRELLGVSSR